MPTRTPDMIEWREAELEQAVEYLNETNPKGYTAERIKAEAIRAWLECATGSTFVGTAGWYVTIIPKSYEATKPYIALVSIMAYSALRAHRER